MVRSWTAAILLAGGGGLLAATGLVGGCTGDEFTTGGGGGGEPASGPASSATGDTTSTGDAASTGASGGECSAGCFASDGCHVEQSAAFCGLGGVGCTTCADPSEECQEAYCDAGACNVRNLQNLTPCEGGGCFEGECRDDVERCLTDDDADDDGKVGCADPDCTTEGYGCLDGAPGFAGPYLVIAGSAAADCPTGLQREGVLYAEPSAKCACTASCGVDLIKAEAPECLVTSSTRQLTDGECDDLTTLSPNALRVQAACLASDGVDGRPPVPEPTESTVTTLSVCPLPGHGCDTTDGCAPPVPAPSGDAQNLLCVGTEDPDRACPPGWEILRPFATSAELACACGCNPPEGGCTGTVTTWTDAQCQRCEAGASEGDPCTTAPVPAANNGNCVPTTVPAEFVRFDADSAEPTPTGSAVFAGGPAGLLCCKPYPLQN